MGEQEPKGLSAEDNQRAKELFGKENAAAYNAELKRNNIEMLAKASTKAATGLSRVMVEIDPGGYRQFKEVMGPGYSEEEFERQRNVLDEAEEILREIKASSELALGLPDMDINRDVYLEQAKQHLRKHKEEYKQQAVKEARDQGVDVNYPPYTDQQKGSETTPDQPQ